jgi:triacylglycerol esterase/lipase EstA (alpha/beta hydrolase family)
MLRRMYLGKRLRVLAVATLVLAGGTAVAAAGPAPAATTTSAQAAIPPPPPPPGANNWSCKPSAAHPDPVVLVHGLSANMALNWGYVSPILASHGYCVFALTYGANPSNPTVGGVISMEDSALQLSAFVDRVLVATSAAKVDIVGHSEGATMPAYYVKFVGGAAKVQRYVGLAPVYHGTATAGLLGALLPASAQTCKSCPEFIPGSPFVEKLNDGGAAVPTVTYTNIVTQHDELVVPYTSGTLEGPNVTNIVVQDQCPLDLVGHGAMAVDPLVAQDILNALDPAHQHAPPCQLNLALL